MLNFSDNFRMSVTKDCRPSGTYEVDVFLAVYIGDP